MSKALNDFISYSSINLTWFAFNFVLCTLPPICIYVLSSDTPDLVKQGSQQSYSTIMYILWGTHIFFFIFALRIYET